METIWLNNLKSYDIAPKIMSEIEGNVYDFLKKKNPLTHINIFTKNLFILEKNNFQDFLNLNSNLIKIGLLENLICKTPTYNSFDNIKCELFSNLQINYQCRYGDSLGISNYIEKFTLDSFINKELEKKNIIGDNSHMCDYTSLCVMGENLSFSITDVLKNAEKNSKAIIFTYLKYLDIAVFFIDSYWEIVREPQPNPMSFNDFISKQGEINILAQPVLTSKNHSYSIKTMF